MGTRITGKQGKVTTGASPAIVASISNWAIDAKLPTVDATAMGDSFHQKLGLIRDWTATVEGYWEQGSTNTQFFDIWNGAAKVQCEFFPDQSTTEKWVGEAFANFNLKAAHDGVVAFSATLEGTGALTRVA